MTVLGVFPATACNREQVCQAYQQVAHKLGLPRAVITDGAVELREPIKSLKTKGRGAISIRDLKHFLANRLKGILNKDREYQSFLGKLGPTRAFMQQTELSHLAPPALRQKARFMNLEPLLNWAGMAIWQLNHPDSQARKGTRKDRFEEKLGWLKEYESALGRWQQLQNVMSTALTLINQQGLVHGIVPQLRQELKPLKNDCTEDLIDRLLRFIRVYEAKLYEGERLPMSSEIIETTFAKFKALEQNHARSGFTQLLLAFPCILKKTKSLEIDRAFAKSKVKDTQAWLNKNIPFTHDGQLQEAYREYRRDRATTNKENRATALAVAV